MRRNTIIAIAAILGIIALLAVLAPQAYAGSNNGTNNWYTTRSCTASGGRLDGTNYDKIIQGTVWQETHLDADRAGGTGAVPKVYMRQTGNTTWRLLSNWNDFYLQASNQWVDFDYKAVFANGSQCAIGAL